MQIPAQNRLAAILTRLASRRKHQQTRRPFRKDCGSRSAAVNRLRARLRTLRGFWRLTQIKPDFSKGRYGHEIQAYRCCGTRGGTLFSGGGHASGAGAIAPGANRSGMGRLRPLWPSWSIWRLPPGWPVGRLSLGPPLSAWLPPRAIRASVLAQQGLLLNSGCRQRPISRSRDKRLSGEIARTRQKIVCRRRCRGSDRRNVHSLRQRVDQDPQLRLFVAIANPSRRRSATIEGLGERQGKRPGARGRRLRRWLRR